MITGSRIIAPKGCGELVSGKVYYFLVNDGGSNRARLIEFDEQGTKAVLHTLTRLRFEEALRAGDLIEDGVQSSPPWLDKVVGIEASWRESARINPQERYEDKVNRRLLAITELIPRARKILVSENPDKQINAHAKDFTPRQHPGRVRLWFYTYLVFGKTKWSLMPSLHRIGSWDRKEKTQKKLGRPSSSGQNSGYPITSDMKEKILAGFLKFKRPDRTKDDIYGDSLTKIFGCKTREGTDGTEFYQPRGEPYPSEWQFWDWVKKQTDPRSLARELQGPSAARAASGDRGSFADNHSNLCQLVEYDGFYPEEKISGFIEGSPLDSFCVVRGTCRTSGAVHAIGFARGRESLEAYRMALFSAAIDKVKFCELFGVEIKESEWPCVGLPAKLVFDRGPAAHMDVSQASDWLSRLELTPTHSGQSKATVEASHPRDKNLKDQKAFLHSGLNLVEMARREIRGVVKDNKSSDASKYMTEDMWLLEFAPTPLNVWQYYDEVGRNDGISMPFDEAVRNFLTPLPAVIRQNGVYFFGRKYNADSLINTGVFDRVARGGNIDVTAYSMAMCVRHIWIEVEGNLHELSFLYTATAKPGSADISLEDLQAIDRARLRGQGKQRRQKVPVKQQQKTSFEEETGKSWDVGVRKIGSPAKNAMAQRDLEDQLRFMGKKS